MRLLSRLRDFKCPFMVTLTVDPTLFPAGPGAAYDYLRKNRCLAEFVRALRKVSDDDTRAADGDRLLRMHSGGYFCALEWQKKKNGGWPHFHLLIDASFVDFNLMCRLWGKFRPPAAGPVLGDRPAFGSVHFTRDALRVKGDRVRAAKYATKYLSKTPEDGFPDWVLNRHRVRRYSTSYKFWGDTPARPKREEVEFCSKCGEHREECTCAKLTIRQRMVKCGQKTALLLVRASVDRNTGQVVESVKYLEELPDPVHHYANRLTPAMKSPYRYDVPPAQLWAVVNAVHGWASGLSVESVAMIAEINRKSASQWAAKAAEAAEVPNFDPLPYRWEWAGMKFVKIFFEPPCNCPPDMP